MEWTYKIIAEPRPRLLVRVAQVFDQQLLVMSSLCLTQSTDQAILSVTVESPESLAHRIEAKLYHLVDVRIVELRRAHQEFGNPDDAPIQHIPASATTEV